MAIIAECLECGKRYRVADERAGTEIDCRQCGGIIEVPGGRTKSRRTRADDYSAPPPARVKSSPRRRTQKAGNNQSLFVGGIIGGAVVVGAALIFGIGKLMSGGGGASVAEAVPTIEPEDLTDEQKAERQAAYDASLSEQRRTSGAHELAMLVERYGKDKVVTIVFEDVVGDAADAHKYLNRKVFRAAYQDYQSGITNARKQTEANRKAAEQEAIRNQQETFGNFGPGFVHYRYQRAESDLPYPRVIDGGRVGNSYTYHAAPALNPQQFAGRVGVGTVAGISGREIRIKSQLPTPIPDPDVEELVLQYGMENVVKINVSGAIGEPDRVQLYLENETEALAEAGASRLTVVAMKPLGEGAFEYYVAPVPNAQVLAERISFGLAEVVSQEERLIAIQASLPDNLPSREELAALKAKQAAEEKAIRDADYDRRPRPGEDELDWALRTLKEDISFGVPKALKALAAMKVRPDRLDEVASVLITSAGTHDSYVKERVAAMTQWHTEATEKAVINMCSDFSNTHNMDSIMQALVSFGSDRCARTLASALPNFFHGDDCVRYLIDMGAAAEEPVMMYLKHEDAKARARTYAVLSEIGTSTSESKVKANIRLERDPQMKARAIQCLESIEARTAK